MQLSLALDPVLDASGLCLHLSAAYGPVQWFAEAACENRDLCCCNCGTRLEVESVNLALRPTTRRQVGQ